MNKYQSVADDFYVNMHLQTAMEISPQRESILHYFEQLQRRFPMMGHFSCRDREFFLDEDRQTGCYRWASCEPKRLSSGMVNFSTLEEALELHQEVLKLAPFALGINHLDCEYLTAVFGFDFNFRGNQSALIAEAVGLPPAFEAVTNIQGAKCLTYEPSIVLSLDDELRTQCRISFESRAGEMSGSALEPSDDQLSVYLAVRRGGSMAPNEKFAEEFERLTKIGVSILDSFLAEHILQPLRDVIAVN